MISTGSRWRCCCNIWCNCSNFKLSSDWTG